MLRMIIPTISLLFHLECTIVHMFFASLFFFRCFGKRILKLATHCNVSTSNAEWHVNGIVQNE